MFPSADPFSVTILAMRSMPSRAVLTLGKITLVIDDSAKPSLT